MGASQAPHAGEFRHSLRVRLLVAALLPILLAVGLFALYFAQRSIREAEQALRQRGGDTVRQMAEAVAFDLFSGNLPYVKRLLDFEREARGAEALAIHEDGGWLLLSGAGGVLPKRFDLPQGCRTTERWLACAHRVGLSDSTEQDPYLALGQSSDRRPMVVAYFDLETARRARAEVFRATLGMSALAVLLALALAWRLASRLSQPLRSISSAVALLADGSLSTRIKAVSSGELGQLEAGVNRMAAALEQNQQELERRVEAATRELVVRKEAAEAATQAKSRFLAAASHDLRQPLHALTLLTSALREQVRQEDARILVEHIDASANALEHLLNALLDLSRLEAGVVEARPECFPAQRTLDNLERQFAPLAREKGLRLRLRPTHLWLDSDPILLERILNNLLGNALRYTDRGGVLAGLRRHGDQVRFEVWDSGRGIPQAFQERIFEEYFQMDNPERHRDKGLGLGLSIVARLARLLNSRVEVQSRPGQGSRFHFCLRPCPPPKQVPIQDAPAIPSPLTGILAAFIDDDQEILEAMPPVLEQWGMDVVAGADPEAVRQQLLEVERGPDLILSDYRLRGGRTGINAVALLRREFGEDIPAAVITGDTAPETIQAINACGLALLHKPLKPAKLRAMLTHLLAVRQAR